MWENMGIVIAPAISAIAIYIVYKFRRAPKPDKEPPDYLYYDHFPEDTVCACEGRIARSQSGRLSPELARDIYDRRQNYICLNRYEPRGDGLNVPVAVKSYTREQIQDMVVLAHVRSHSDLPTSSGVRDDAAARRGFAEKMAAESSGGASGVRRKDGG